MRSIARALLQITPLVVLTLSAALVTPGCGGAAATNALEDEGLIVVRRSETGDPRSIDPHIAGDVVSSRHCGMAYDTLMQYDYLKEPPELVPNLLAEKPHYDAETLTYTFKLRDDVYFHDNRCFHSDAKGKTYREEGEGKQDQTAPGRKLVAMDMVYSFKRLFALADSGGYWVLEGYIKGLDSFRGKALGLLGTGPADDSDKPWRDYFDSPVEGLTAPDSRTFVVKLTQPYPQFLYAITLSYGAAVPREAAEYYRKDYFRKPVGTGPFLLSSWRPNWELVWLRNPKFRQEVFPTSTHERDAMYKPLMGKRLPIADKVDFRIIKEAQPAYLKFLKGELDLSGIDKDNFSRAVLSPSEVTPNLKEMGISVRSWADPTLDYMCFNMTDPVVGMQDDSPQRARAREKARAIRRAVCLCYDREDFIRRYLNGRGLPAAQLIPPGILGHQERNNMKSQRFDPEAARAVLKEAGFKLEGSGDGPWKAVDPDTGKQATVTISLRDNTERGKDEARFYKASGDKVGVNIVGEPLTFNEFLKRQDEGKGQAYDAGWVMDYPDAQNMVQLLYGPNRPPGINAASYDDPEFNRLYDELKVLDDADPVQFKHKLDVLAQMHEILERDVPWLLVNFRVTYGLYNPWFTPQKPNEFAYSFGKFWYSDSAKRSKAAEARSETVQWPALLMAVFLVIPAALMTARIVRQAR